MVGLQTESVTQSVTVNISSPKTSTSQHVLDEDEQTLIQLECAASSHRGPKRRVVMVVLGAIALIGVLGASIPTLARKVSDVRSNARRSSLQAPVNCPTGYEQVDGDIPGDGSINGEGGGEWVEKPQDCAALCNSQAACSSFEFQPDSHKCNLNTDGEPTHKQWRNQLFCRKLPVDKLCPSRWRHADQSEFGHLGVFYAGDEARDAGEVAGQEECHERCNTAEECHTFVFQPQGSRCFLGRTTVFEQPPAQIICEAPISCARTYEGGVFLGCVCHNQITGDRVDVEACFG